MTSRLEMSCCLSKDKDSQPSKIRVCLLCVAEERRAAGFVPTTGLGFGLAGPLSFDAEYPEVVEDTTDSASYRETISEIEPLLGVVWRLSGAVLLEGLGTGKELGGELRRYPD